MTDRTIPSCPKCGETEMTSHGPKCGCTPGEMAEGLFAEPEKDGFKKESPIRAFTEFKINGQYAIGKGFRPSLAHLVEYLDAMMTKEGWQLVQIIEATAPTMIFRRPIPWMHVIPPVSEFTKSALGEPYEPRGQQDPEHRLWTEIKWPLEPTVALTAAWAVNTETAKAEARRFLDEEQATGMKRFFDVASVASMRRALDKFVPSWDMKLVSLDDEPEVASDDEAAAYKRTKDGVFKMPVLMPDDPITPQHYHGRDCADLGAHMTANSFQVLKYNWWLGEKDNPCVEISKALWYLEAEIDLFAGQISDCPAEVPGVRFPDWQWVKARTDNAPSEHAKEVASKLISWNRHGRMPTLNLLRTFLQAKLNELSGCTDWELGEGLRP